MRPLPRAWRAFGRAWLLLVFLAGPLSGQSTAARAGLRGELVRWPSAAVDVSIFAPDHDAVPAVLWGRVSQAQRVWFYAGGSPDASEVVRGKVSGASGSGVLRIVEDQEDLGPVAVRITAGDQVRLDWEGLTEDEGVEILADARAADEAFSLTILIPNPTGTQDWWGLQAALSQAGIRRVRILSGRP